MNESERISQTVSNLTQLVDEHWHINIESTNESEVPEDPYDMVLIVNIIAYDARKHVSRTISETEIAAFTAKRLSCVPPEINVIGLQCCDQVEEVLSRPSNEEKVTSFQRRMYCNAVLYFIEKERYEMTQGRVRLSPQTFEENAIRDKVNGRLGPIPSDANDAFYQDRAYQTLLEILYAYGFYDPDGVSRAYFYVASWVMGMGVDDKKDNRHHKGSVTYYLTIWYATILRFCPHGIPRRELDQGKDAVGSYLIDKKKAYEEEFDEVFPPAKRRACHPGFYLL